mmetsp:Transcript_5503/g.7950  ORF Transcript_5503/g.7950 Transcript_5503/m.7950 type:complete len:119 (-) Transcript_5503:189-545(-)|eukprot:CAMPEP_0201690394 /NCGR_PEP_ID=MMETSP0578-20130828/3844_1 /ASSEMBLY_ACC=CAM_ASM_000663 /TAXON_ID=267565 /ORGANISM="Skeletonema grethea, Strain CCMP 1804" /LENGTH=118 /DNA_ID=CAMNT_0048175369 /DNA_START=521 /DNA_END=877 /DNA_ORIENTATION=+
MRNPVNRLATAAPRAFDSILFKQPTSTTSSSTTSDSTNTTTQEHHRGRSASFHVDLSVLLHSSAVEGVAAAAAAGSVCGVDTMASVGDETGSVLTFDATGAMDMIPNWGWNEESEVGL